MAMTDPDQTPTFDPSEQELRDAFAEKYPGLTLRTLKLWHRSDGMLVMQHAWEGDEYPEQYSIKPGTPAWIVVLDVQQRRAEVQRVRDTVKRRRGKR